MDIDKAKKEIEELIKVYARSINEADTELAATVWSPTEDVSFITPKGHRHGWEEICAMFYGKMMGSNFSKRDLRVYNQEIQCYGAMATVVFYWEFNAVWKEDGEKLKTEGRESQFYRNDGKRWLLTHVHYSNMPVTGAREGF